MQIESLNEKTILEQAVFDYLFSIEDVSKHDLKMYEFEDRASELKVKARFTSRYKNEKRARDKIKADERKRLSKEQIATQKQSTTSNMTSFGAEDYPELFCNAWECDQQGVRITDYNGVKQACYHPIMPVKRLVNVETGKEKMVVAFNRDGVWQEQIEWYFNSCINDDMKPSLSGLARCLGCDLETMRRWTNGERRGGQPHGGLIKKAREIVQEMYVQYMTNGELNPVAGIFLMGNDFDYERESGTTVNNVQITQSISPQQLEDKYNTIVDCDYVEVQEPKLLPPEE